MKTLFNHLLVYLVIAFSVTIYFTTNEYLLATLTLMLLIIIFLRKIRLDKRYVRFLVLFVTVILIQSIVIDHFSIRTFIGSIIRFLFPLLVIALLRKEYIPAFIKIVYYLTVVGLILFVLKNLVPGFNSILINLGETLPFDNVSGENFLIYSSRSGIRFGSIMSNSGFAYEPGAYSVILIIALIFNNVWNGTIFDKHGIVFIFALLSTFSTAGYIGLMVVLFAYAYENMRDRKILIGLSLLIILVFTVPFIIETEFMGEKISSQVELSGDRYETRGRFASGMADVQLWLTSPIFGVGKGADAYESSVYAMGFASTHRVNGLANFLAKYGIVIFASYIYLMYRSIKKVFEYHNKQSGFFLYFVAILAVAFAQGCMQWSAFILLMYLDLGVVDDCVHGGQSENVITSEKKNLSLEVM